MKNEWFSKVENKENENEFGYFRNKKRPNN